jgi:superfamily II DNA or RNA helicase
VKLRPYQAEAIETIKDKIANGETNVCLFAPTAYGKSIVITELARFYSQNTKVVILTNITKLIMQLEQHLINSNIEPNVVKAGLDKEVGSNVTLMMQQTAHRRQIGDKHKGCILIVDEYHISYNSQTMTELIARLEPSAIIGLSATPINADGSKLDRVQIIETASVDELTEQKYLTPVKNYIASFAEKIDLSDVDIQKKGDFNEVQLSKIINTPVYNDAVLCAWEKIASNKKTIIFATGVNHAENLCKVFKDKGYKAAVVHSQQHERENNTIFDDFRANKTQVLVSVSMITTGFDEPSVECAVMCRPTQVLRLYHQCVGRIMRLSDNKEEAIFIDMAQCIGTHGLANEKLHFFDRVSQTSELKLHKENSKISNISLVSEEIIEVADRKALEVKIEEARETLLTNLNPDSLAKLLDSSKDLWETINFVFELDLLVNHNQKNLKTMQWIYGKWTSGLIDNEHKKNKWLKALKTRSVNIIRAKKKIASLGYFIDFLVDEEVNKGWI